MTEAGDNTIGGKLVSITVGGVLGGATQSIVYAILGAIASFITIEILKATGADKAIKEFVNKIKSKFRNG